MAARALMASSTDSTTTSKRERVEPGIYRRGDKYDIYWRDSQGKQRMKAVKGGITVARKALRAEQARRDRGEHVTADPRLRFDDAAQQWWDARVVKLRPNTQRAYKDYLAHLKRP